MNEIKKIYRRKFLKVIASVLTIPLVGLWVSELKVHLSFTEGSSKIELPSNLNEGVTFLGKIIIEKKGEKIKIFSSQCTHLGCKINQEIHGKFVCPCHGSKFDLNGNVVNGPAISNLKQLQLVKEKRTGKMIVYV